MTSYIVTLGRSGAGSSTFKVAVHAATPDEARRIAEAQHVGYSAHAVRVNP